MLIDDSTNSLFIFKNFPGHPPKDLLLRPRLVAAGHPASLPEAAFGRNQGAPWVKYGDVAGEHDMSAGDFMVILVMKRMI